MKIIINSFFRNIGKFFAYIFILIIVYLFLHFLGFDFKSFLDVHALDTNSWYTDDLYLTSVNITNGVNGSNTGTITNGSIPGTDHRNMIKISQTSNGHIFVFNTPQLNANYSYLLQLYMCGPAATTFNLSSYYFGTAYNNLSAYNINSASWTNLGKPTPNSIDSNCRMLQIQVTPNARFNYIGLKNTGTYNDALNFYGIKLYTLGVSGSILESAVNGINSTLGGQTTTITNNANSNKNLIINNANSNQQVITTNNTSNTNRIINNANSNQQQTNEGLSNINQNTKETNDLIKDDSIDDSHANSYFQNFQQDTYGIQDIINVPLHYIQRLTTETCQPLSFTLPFVHSNVSLPCMDTIYRTYFNTWYGVYQTLMLGIVCYGVGIKIMREVRDALNPMSTGRVQLIKL